MKLSRATIALYMTLVFASGAAVGVFGNRYYQASVQTASNKGKGRRPPTQDEFRKMYLANMQKELLLSEDQVQKLTAILDETRRLMNDLHQRQAPEQQELQRSQNAKIRAVLDSVQQEKYDAMMKRLAERAKNKANKTRPGF
jgi:Spy/CpxP family protein refolding chaperone